MEWQPGVMLDRIDVDGDLIRFQLHSLAFAGRVSGRTLARGGMASIFKAIDSESGAAVVLKILSRLVEPAHLGWGGRP